VPTAARKTPPQRRRSPVQKRARDTVDIVLQAAAQILARQGPEAATTNAIAGRAGVSIGTLYQYFRDKDALIDELVRRHIAEMEAVMAAALAGVQDRSIAEAAEQFVAAILAAHRVDPRLHQALHQVLPRGRMASIDRLERGLEERVGALLAAREGFSPAAAEQAAVVVVRTIGGFVRTTLRRDPERLADAAIGRRMRDVIVAVIEAARGEG
jgi:AcrR family transcriptional regulator